MDQPIPRLVKKKPESQCWKSSGLRLLTPVGKHCPGQVNHLPWNYSTSSTLQVSISQDSRRQIRNNTQDGASRNLVQGKAFINPKAKTNHFTNPIGKSDSLINLDLCGKSLCWVFCFFPIERNTGLICSWCCFNLSRDFLLRAWTHYHKCLIAVQTVFTHCKPTQVPMEV
jgi:hypothetical protein